MKTALKTTHVLPLTLLVFCLGISQAFAADPPGKGVLTLTPTVGGYSFDGSQDLDTSLLYGLKLGYEIRGKGFRDSLGVEAVGLVVEAGDGRNGADVTVFRLDALYPFVTKGDLSPFLTVGAGAILVDGAGMKEEAAIIAYGGGARYFLDNFLALRFDLRHILWFDSSENSNIESTLGLTWLFGQERRKRPLPPPDEDRDGVPDERDRCPGTDPGTEVNRQGCPARPTDSDGDKIFDHLDRCPETPAGATVDEKGCLRDSDADGVPDDSDECPETPPGVKVKEDGCV